jgi:hypothetical protein
MPRSVGASTEQLEIPAGVTDLPADYKVNWLRFSINIEFMILN